MLGFKLKKLRDGQKTSPGFEDLISLQNVKKKETQNKEEQTKGEEDKKTAGNESPSLVGGVSTKEHEVLNDSVLY